MPGPARHVAPLIGRAGGRRKVHAEGQWGRSRASLGSIQWRQPCREWMCGAWRDGGTAMEAGWWVVVADSARARIFMAAELPAPLREIEDLIRPEGRLPERALPHDRPGRSFVSVGGARHASSPHASPRAASRHRFAERIADRIADRIDRGLAEGSFRRLALVAPPAMLGALQGGAFAAVQGPLRA